MSNYELTYIVRPVEEANLTAISERIANTVRNAGGEIVARNDWGRRRLAYPIRKLGDGYYTTLYLTLPGSAVRGVERSLQLTEDILRYLVVRVETLNAPTPPAAPAASAAGASVEAPAAPLNSQPALAAANTTAAEATAPTGEADTAPVAAQPTSAAELAEAVPLSPAPASEGS